MKKVVVIGAGISGLTAAIYAKRSGFDVFLFEQHHLPGGFCTSWSRKGYLFEGGMHWLGGSTPKVPLYNVWKEVGALQENNPLSFKDPFYTLPLENGRALSLYRDLEKTRKCFLEFAPEDKKMIERLYRDIKSFLTFHSPVKDIAHLKTRTKHKLTFREIIQFLPAFLKYPRLVFTSYQNYLQKFKNKNLRHLLAAVIGARHNALSFIFTLAGFMSGDSGYPEGGSLRLAQNMAKTFTHYGGKIFYKTEVLGIEVNGDKIKGVKIKRTSSENAPSFFEADAVICTQDILAASKSILPLSEPWFKELENSTIPQLNTFICYGIKKDLKHYPQTIVYPFEPPLSLAGLEFHELRINNYAAYKNHSPEGTTSLTILLLGDNYEYWNTAHKEGNYSRKKEELLQKITTELEKRIPEIKGSIEVSDIATPLTYERYTKAYHGSWMSVWRAKKFIPTNYHLKSKKIKGLYFAGHRLSLSGGLPIAVLTGRKAAQYLCRDNGVEFV